MAIPGDAHYTDRSRHSVQLGDGRTVSRAAAENIAARAGGFQSNYERRAAFREMKSSPGYGREREAAGDQGTSRREFDDARARLYAEYRGNDYNWNRTDKSTNGPLANYLRAIGRKSDTDLTPVGESPGTK